jgi:putative addiction module component (TIGR02574 family)
VAVFGQSVPLARSRPAAPRHYNVRWKLGAFGERVMTEPARTLGEQARKLSPEDRIELVDDILASLDEPDPNIDQLWANEAEQRLAAYRRGEIRAVPLQEVLAKYRAR